MFLSDEKHGKIILYMYVQCMYFVHNIHVYTTAKKKRPNQLCYLVGIWL